MMKRLISIIAFILMFSLAGCAKIDATMVLTQGEVLSNPEGYVVFFCYYEKDDGIYATFWDNGEFIAGAREKCTNLKSLKKDLSSTNWKSVKFSSIQPQIRGMMIRTLDSEIEKIKKGIKN